MTARRLYKFCHLELMVSLTSDLSEDEILISKRPDDALFIIYVIIYNNMHSDWLRTCQLIPNQCKKV